jgi:hypothetical protein
MHVPNDYIELCIFRLCAMNDNGLDVTDRHYVMKENGLSFVLLLKTEAADPLVIKLLDEKQVLSNCRQIISIQQHYNSLGIEYR